MKSLKSTIFFFFVALLLAVQAMFLQIVYRAIQQEEANQVQYQLDTARTVFQAQFESRRESLGAFAETAARDFGLKQVFEEDTRSFLVALDNHRQRIDADIALAVTAEGQVSAQLVNEIDADGRARVVVGPEQGQPFRFPDWLDLQDDSRLYPLGPDFYQLNLAPLSNGSLIVGWIGFGYSVDQRLARYYAELTELNTDFAVRRGGRWTVLASSRANIDTPAHEDLVNLIMEGSQPEDVIATTYTLGNAGEDVLATLMYGDRTDLLTEIRGRWRQLGLLGALTLCLSLAGAFVIATRISRPVQVLAEQAKRIAGGDYDLSFTLRGGGELGQLADEFRHMQQALQSRERLISHHAYHEDLSGLPNRNRLIQVLEEWTAGTQPFCLSKFSIRRINHINSSLGHDIGDEVIKTVAKRLGSILQPEHLFHLGGSEFVVLNPRAAAEQAEVHMYLVMKLMEPKFRYQGISLYIELQAGIALFPGQDDSASGLLRKASAALQAAKKHALPFVLYHEDMGSENTGYLQLINDLKTAIDQAQLVLHYQPKLDLASGRVEQVEALVRWLHPEQGLIAPDRFIPAAEQTGLIHGLTRWVLQEAARQHEAWLAEGIRLSIAVNISAQNFKDPGFHDMVMKTLADAGVGREAISLEMTESAVMDDLEAAVALLGRFQEAGILMSIDDYGTGYSALAQLKQLPVSELKIDRSFIRSLLEDKDNPIIVRSTIELAHNMGLLVVAEGVEDQAALDWLKQHHCDLVQGYHVCRPAAGAELAAWLRRQAPAEGSAEAEARESPLNP